MPLVSLVTLETAAAAGGARHRPSRHYTDRCARPGRHETHHRGPAGDLAGGTGGHPVSASGPGRRPVVVPKGGALQSDVDADRRWPRAVDRAVGDPSEIPMKVTFVTATPSLAGGHRVSVIHADRLRRRGHDANFIADPARPLVQGDRPLPDPGPRLAPIRPARHHISRPDPDPLPGRPPAPPHRRGRRPRRRPRGRHVVGARRVGRGCRRRRGPRSSSSRTTSARPTSRSSGLTPRGGCPCTRSSSRSGSPTWPARGTATRTCLSSPTALTSSSSGRRRAARAECRPSAWSTAASRARRARLRWRRSRSPPDGSPACGW